ncbi:MAG: protein-glutamate O-methyltransferase CheR [Thermoanaerobaculia bacterium]|nr:protein-glutamate O-methyltransferase CheR [Thermoanaerobaculia bacterium]
MSDLPDESREPREIAELAELVRRETGSDLPAGRLGVLRDTAERRRRALGLADLDAYVAALAAGSLPGEWQRLATRLTIKESSFFRVPQQWERIRTKVLPELLHARAANRRLRCWSAACAAGEEPGTLALLLADAPALAGWDWSILATDLDVEALAEAGRGLYGERAIAGVPPPLRETWFRRRGSLWELDPRLRAKIAYRPLNLARPPWLLPEEAFDLVLLRNVLIYFRPELQRLVVERVADRLAPEGWLFLGGSETLWRVQERLVAVDLGDCFAYRHEGAAPAAPRARGPARTARAANTAKARPADGPDRRPAAAPSPAPAALPVPGPHPPRAPASNWPRRCGISRPTACARRSGRRRRRSPSTPPTRRRTCSPACSAISAGARTGRWRRCGPRSTSSPASPRPASSSPAASGAWGRRRTPNGSSARWWRRSSAAAAGGCHSSTAACSPTSARRSAAPGRRCSRPDREALPLRSPSGRAGGAGARSRRRSRPGPPPPRAARRPGSGAWCRRCRRRPAR